MGWMRRFRKCFAPLPSSERYHVRRIDLSTMSICRALKESLRGRHNILDIGCGMGYVTHYLKATGMDINPEAIPRAKKLYPKTRFVCMDLAEIAKWGRIGKAELGVLLCVAVPR